RRFGNRPNVRENNITAWRRAVVGDLTSAFDFRTPNDRPFKLPNTDAFFPPDNKRHADYKPTVPDAQALPPQEPGVRPARPVPYELHVVGRAEVAQGRVTIDFVNTGGAAAVFQVRSGSGVGAGDGPWTYTVGAGDDIEETW